MQLKIEAKLKRQIDELTKKQKLIDRQKDRWKVIQKRDRMRKNQNPVIQNAKHMDRFIDN